MNAHDEIKQFIIAHVEKHPEDISKLTAEQFGITRQAVHRHLNALIKDGQLKATGNTRRKRYALEVTTIQESLTLAENQDEDRVWRTFVEPNLKGLPANVLKICQYGFTEIFNNAIEHSEGTEAQIEIERTARSVTIVVYDNGIGIFEKIKASFHLEDYRHALLELSKGKLTTDPKRHSGEGVFFCSRVFDEFSMCANLFVFFHGRNTDTFAGEDVPPEDEKHAGGGTRVSMEIAIDSPRTLKEVFDRYADPDADDYGFSRTLVPLRLTRSTVRISWFLDRRLGAVLARIERFKEVYLDFSGIETIGQAFADEIFRVYATDHPEIKLTVAGANQDVARMIRRVRPGPERN